MVDIKYVWNDNVCPKCLRELKEVMTPFVLESKEGEPIHGMMEELVCPTCDYRRPKAEPPAQVDIDSEVCPACGAVTKI